MPKTFLVLWSVTWRKSYPWESLPNRSGECPSLINKMFGCRGLPGNCGTVTIACEEVEENQREHIEMNCHATKLDKKDFFGKSDPFLKIYRMNEDGR